MKLKKVLAMGLTGAMTLSMITGCGASSDSSSSDSSSSKTSEKKETKDVTLTVWGPQEDQAKVDGYDNGILKAMCDKFNEAHPEWNITFKYGVCSEGDAKKLVTKDVDAAADVYMYANDQIPVLAKAGALSKLGGKNVEDMKATNEQTMVDSVTYKKSVYGFPYTSNTWFMYYDKSKYTADQVKSLDTMMDKNLGKGVTNFAFALDNSWYIPAFYYAAGGQLFGEKGDDAKKGCNFNDANGVAVTKYLANLAANKKFSCEKEGSSISKFKKGKLGAYCSGSWDAKAIRDALGKNFAVTTIPTVTINQNEGQMRSFAGSKAVGVNPVCKNPEVAVALAAYLAGEECQQIRFETRGIVPTNKTVSESKAVKADVVAQTQAQEIANAAVVQPMLDEMANYWTPAETMGKELVQGNINDKNAQEKVDAMVKGILAK